MHKYRPSARDQAFARRALALAGACVLTLGACSLDYGTALSEELDDGMPDSVLYGFKHTVVENGRRRFTLEADTASSYDKNAKIEFEAVEFREYGEDGEIVALGSSDGLSFYPDTESADLSGSVEFFRSKDDLLVQSDYLRWDGEAKLLSSRDDVLTRVRNAQSSAISGGGFSADAARRSFSFTNGAQGSLREAASAEGGD